MLQRSAKMSTSASADSASATGSSEASVRHEQAQRAGVQLVDAREQDVQREPQRKIGDDADDGGGDGAQRRGEPRRVRQALDVGRADEDPQEAWRERRPQRDERAEHADANAALPQAPRCSRRTR